METSVVDLIEEYQSVDIMSLNTVIPSLGVMESLR